MLPFPFNSYIHLLKDKGSIISQTAIRLQYCTEGEMSLEAGVIGPFLRCEFLELCGYFILPGFHFI